jgi:hypothetical protein
VRAQQTQAGGAAATTPPQSPPSVPGPEVKPCADEPHHRQLDFWLGEWDVQEQDGKHAGDNSLRLILDGCVVAESYTEPNSFAGRSFSFYDATLGKWRQTWVDRFGSAHEYAGEFCDGAMRFEGEVHGLKGKRVLARMTVTPLGPDRVRQLGEQSADGGKTWVVGYDYIYVRKK